MCLHSATTDGVFSRCAAFYPLDIPMRRLRCTLADWHFNYGGYSDFKGLGTYFKARWGLQNAFTGALSTCLPFKSKRAGLWHETVGQFLRRCLSFIYTTIPERVKCNSSPTSDKIKTGHVLFFSFQIKNDGYLNFDFFFLNRHTLQMKKNKNVQLNYYLECIIQLKQKK